MRLAIVTTFDRNYKEAGKWFTKFTKLKLKKNLPEYKRKAKEEIEVCELAAIWMRNPLPVKVEKISVGSIISVLFLSYLSTLNLTISPLS